MAARGVSGVIRATVAVRQSVALITLFKPRVSAVVVAERLPEAGFVVVGEEVRILRIHGPGQPPVTASELGA